MALSKRPGFTRFSNDEVAVVEATPNCAVCQAHFGEFPLNKLKASPDEMATAVELAVLTGHPHDLSKVCW
jgi:hypothetical protein